MHPGGYGFNGERHPGGAPGHHNRTPRVASRQSWQSPHAEPTHSVPPNHHIAAHMRTPHGAAPMHVPQPQVAMAALAGQVISVPGSGTSSDSASSAGLFRSLFLSVSPAYRIVGYRDAAVVCNIAVLRVCTLALLMRLLLLD